MTTIDAMRKKF